MLGFRFSYLYKLHTESFLGFNAVCLPGNPPGAFYRSSLPATPVSTPIRENGRFSEQALRERLCRTPSPRKCRLFESRVSEPDIGLNALDSGLQLSSPDDEIDEDQPSSVFSPLRPRIETRLEHLEHEKENAPVTRLKRRIFVGNISYRVTKKELQDFFSKFGKVVDCLIVQDHIKKRPRGYGFIIFSTQHDAEKARNASPSQLELDGRILRVFSAEEKRTAKLRKEAREILFQQNIENGSIENDTNNANDQCYQRVCKSSSLQNINEMNDDILLLIFGYLSLRERVKIELVCKKWCNLALRLWQSQDNLEFQHVFSVFRGFPLTNNILRCLLKKCAFNLRKLELSTASHVLDYQAVEVIAQYCPKLEEVNLSSVKVTNVSLQQLALKCPKLKSVILQRCLEVGEKGIWWLLHLCKKLECIDLTGNPRITGQCFHMAGSSLLTAVLNRCSRFSPAGFMKLATRCRQLSALYLNDCFQLTDRALELLCQSLRNLKILHVGGVFTELTSSGLHHIGRLNNLEELSVAHNHSVDDDVVYAISRGCRKLKFLDISGCYTGVSDYSLSSLSACYQLRKLHINYLDKVTDEGLSSISRQGQLEVVQTRGCPNVGDQGFLTLVLLCPYLRHLDVSGCQHVTNITVTACLDTVQARSSGEKLCIITGGTNVELEALELDSCLLEVSRLNFCADHLRPDRADYFALAHAGEAEEDDELDGVETQGAIGGDYATSSDTSRENEDPAVIFDSEWDEVLEAPI